jgi:hypothetical protein
MHTSSLSQVLLAGCSFATTSKHPTPSAPGFPAPIESSEIYAPLAISTDRGLNWARLNFTATVSIADVALVRSANAPQRVLAAARHETQFAGAVLDPNPARRLVSQLGIWRTDQGGMVNNWCEPVLILLLRFASVQYGGIENKILSSNSWHLCLT